MNHIYLYEITEVPTGEIAYHLSHLNEAKAAIFERCGSIDAINAAGHTTTAYGEAAPYLLDMVKDRACSANRACSATGADTVVQFLRVGIGPQRETVIRVARDNLPDEDIDLDAMLEQVRELKSEIRALKTLLREEIVDARWEERLEVVKSDLALLEARIGRVIALFHQRRNPRSSLT